MIDRDENVVCLPPRTYDSYIIILCHRRDKNDQTLLDRFRRRITRSTVWTVRVSGFLRLSGVKIEYVLRRILSTLHCEQCTTLRVHKSLFFFFFCIRLCLKWVGLLNVMTESTLRYVIGGNSSRLFLVERSRVRKYSSATISEAVYTAAIATVHLSHSNLDRRRGCRKKTNKNN